jgi:hypothetical protein
MDGTITVKDATTGQPMTMRLGVLSVSGPTDAGRGGAGIVVTRRRGMAKNTMSTKTTPDKPKPPKDDPLDAYLQIAREGEPHPVSVNQQFWVGSLNDSGHTGSLYAKTREEIEERAKTILSVRGVEA